MNDNYQIRKANEKDVPSITRIYDEIHQAEETGKMCVGWKRSIYPTCKTAQEGIQRGDMFICEVDGNICASAIINQKQMESYNQGNWSREVPNSDVMVLHTLTVSPSSGKKGIGRAFITFYEKYALENHCHSLRIDTQAKNSVAREMYAKLGFKEVGIIDCDFQGLDNIQLVLLEKII